MASSFILGRIWAAEPKKDLAALGLDQLMSMEVTSVSKSPQRSFQASAAIAVLTGEEIRRSGVTSIPEALRLLPGIEVARITTSQWSVGVRGFGNRLARATLVLIDGRSVYSPLFAGTYWEAQDTLLEDIDRIEVIRGPGGALWGANAVNGIINIITKNSKETQGSLATAGAGTEERGFTSYRYGGATSNEKGHYRLYGKYMDRGSSYSRAREKYDDWQQGQGGFRSDWVLSDHDQLTIQGDGYKGKAGQRVANALYEAPFFNVVEEDSDLAGLNLLTRWSHHISSLQNRSLQFYYDRTTRDDPNIAVVNDTFDLDYQESFPIAERHHITTGLEYRINLNNPEEVIETLRFVNDYQEEQLYGAFAQDQISVLNDRLTLTLGAKVEHNDYTGWETQPNGRFAWAPSYQQTLWGAISRAVRTPSRFEEDLEIAALDILQSPPTSYIRIVGNPHFQSEEVLAYEAGYRVQANDSLVFGINGFYNQYDDLLSAERKSVIYETPTRAIHEYYLGNKLGGHTYGGEFGTFWSISRWWQMRASYSYLKMNLWTEDGSTEGSRANTDFVAEGSSPRHQLAIRSSINLFRRWEFDPTLRYVSALDYNDIPEYVTMDIRIACQASDSLEFAIVGQNLFQARHPEFGTTNEIERGVYGKVTWKN